MPEPLLDNDDLRLLNEAMQALEDNDENLIRAEQAGIDVTAVKKRADETRDQIRRVKGAFFPGQ